MNLDFAMLTYGKQNYKIEPSAHLPLPLQFDFDNAEECARKIFAIMSNASGGFTLENCTLRLNRKRKSANLTSNGSHIYYADKSLPKLTVEEAIQMAKDTQIIKLGAVATDQYGEGWTRAKWQPEKAAA